jgi:hypothetical protein
VRQTEGNVGTLGGGPPKYVTYDNIIKEEKGAPPKCRWLSPISAVYYFLKPLNIHRVHLRFRI